MEILAYSQWCQYMDSLKHQRTHLGWRAIRGLSATFNEVRGLGLRCSACYPANRNARPMC